MYYIRIEEAFDIFDHEQNKTVDVREVGTVIRSLGCYPTQSELTDMIQVSLPIGVMYHSFTLGNRRRRANRFCTLRQVPTNDGTSTNRG